MISEEVMSLGKLLVLPLGGFHDEIRYKLNNSAKAKRDPKY